MAEKWPEMVLKWAFVIVIHLDSEYNLKTSRPRVAPLPFRPCSYLMTLYIFIETWLHRLWYSISIASPLIETLRYQAILVMLLKVIHNSYHNRAYKLLIWIKQQCICIHKKDSIFQESYHSYILIFYQVLLLTVCIRTF